MQAFAGWRLIGASGATDLSGMLLYLWPGSSSSVSELPAVGMGVGNPVSAGVNDAAAAAVLGKRQRDEQQQQQQVGEGTHKHRSHKKKTDKLREDSEVPGSIHSDVEQEVRGGAVDELHREEKREVSAPLVQGAKRYRRSAAGAAAAVIAAAVIDSDDGLSGDGWFEGDAPLPSYTHSNRRSSSSSEEEEDDEVEQQQQQQQQQDQGAVDVAQAAAAAAAGAAAGAAAQQDAGLHGLPRSSLINRKWLAADGTAVYAKVRSSSRLARLQEQHLNVLKAVNVCEQHTGIDTLRPTQVEVTTALGLTQCQAISPVHPSVHSCHHSHAYDVSHLPQPLHLYTQLFIPFLPYIIQNTPYSMCPYQNHSAHSIVCSEPCTLRCALCPAGRSCHSQPHCTKPFGAGACSKPFS
jgi:hypothetical protein